jgi:hypothetical protein
MSNSYNLELTWVITFPDRRSLATTYDQASDDTRIVLGMGVATTLTEYVEGYYVESIIELRVLQNVSMDGTQLTCSSSVFDSATIFVPVDSESKTVIQQPNINLTSIPPSLHSRTIGPNTFDHYQ